jgi:acetyl esterase/lipase
MTVPTETPQWTGPARFLPPPEPFVRADGARHFSGVTYAVPFGYRPLQLDLWVPATATPAPLVVYIHGGGWMFGDRRYLPETLRPNELFDAMLEAGLSVASIDYRHALEAKFPAQLNDAKAAVRFLRAHAGELGISTRRIGVMGESAGGHLAALVGLTAHRPDLEGNLGVVGPASNVDVVVDWYGPADMETMPRKTLPPEIAATLPPELATPPEDHLLAGLDAQSTADASPINHVTADAPPFLLVHGTADWLVPYQQSEELAAALRGAGVPAELVPIDGAEHIFNGAADINSIVRTSVNYLAKALLEEPK